MTRKEILEKTINFDDAIHRIVRLEKENANLKKSCDETQELLDKQIEATYKLDKENAELKKLKRECETSLCRAEYQYNYEQLTKAKELLIRFVMASVYFNGKETDLVEEAEQFLSGVEK